MQMGVIALLVSGCGDNQAAVFPTLTSYVPLADSLFTCPSMMNWIKVISTACIVWQHCLSKKISWFSTSSEFKSAKIQQNVNRSMTPLQYFPFSNSSQQCIKTFPFSFHFLTIWYFEYWNFSQFLILIYTWVDRCKIHSYLASKYVRLQMILHFNNISYNWSYNIGHITS